MCELESPRISEPDPVPDAGVHILVVENEISALQQGRQQSEVGIVSGIEDQGSLSPVEFPDDSLRFCI